MKKIIVLICIAISGIVTSYAQMSPEEQMISNLTTYQTLCKQIVEHIDKLLKSSSNLSEKTKDNSKLRSLINQINSRTRNIYKNVESIDKLVLDLTDSLENQITQLEPSEKIKGPIDLTPVEEIPEKPTPLRRNNAVVDYLKGFLLEELYDSRNEIKDKLNEINNLQLKNVYLTIIELLEIPHNLYDRPNVRNVLQKASSIKEEQLVCKEHFEDLQRIITQVKEYRYATMELQRLIKIISNPPAEILNELGQDSSGDRKLSDLEESIVPSAAIKNYLIKKNETEYVFKFDYTKETFNRFVEQPEERENIIRSIDEALK